MRTLIPFVKTLPSWPKNLPEASSYNTVRFGDQGFNMWIWEAHKHSDHGSKLSRSSSPLAWPVVLIGVPASRLAFLWYVLHTAFCWAFYMLTHPSVSFQLFWIISKWTVHPQASLSPGRLQSPSMPPTPIFYTLDYSTPDPRLCLPQAWLRSFYIFGSFCLESTLL